MGELEERGLLPVAGLGPIHTEEPKVAVAASQPRALPVLELTAGAQTFHLEAVQVEGQAEGEPAVPSGDELEGLYGREKAFECTFCFL